MPCRQVKLSCVLSEKQKKKKRKSDVKEEAFEDSDDGDDEGREMDYISDSSERCLADCRPPECSGRVVG